MNKKPPMTPREFAKEMRELFPPPKTKEWYEDPTGAHVLADRLMCKLLRQLGYGAGVRHFENGEKWYS